MDPTFFFDADPDADPTFQFDTDSVPVSHQSDANLLHFFEHLRIN
jgi:hypothetical protein